MKILLLGYGQEGKSTAAYFRNRADVDLEILDSFSRADLAAKDFSSYDLVFRSPSVYPLDPSWTSITKYFFAHCPCPIIGVTGTKGKGTTCSLITKLLEHLGHKVWLVGNIGKPALDVLDQIQKANVVVYELSSYQLWDLDKSPHVAVVLRIEPDHLNVHTDYDDYVQAKSNITRHQSPQDYCIYYRENTESQKIAQLSPGKKIGYPDSKSHALIAPVLDQLTVPGQHNRENAEAALFAVAAYLGQPIEEFIQKNLPVLSNALHNFQGLPHRLQFLREAKHVAYYDDNFSAAFPALDVALAAFPEQKIVLIAGGKDRGLDLQPAKQRLFHDTPNLEKVFLMGETSEALAANEDPQKYQVCTSLDSAFIAARQFAETLAKEASDDLPIVLLMSPGAPSFDMFKNFTDRGEQFQKLVAEVN